MLSSTRDHVDDGLSGREAGKVIDPLYFVEPRAKFYDTALSGIYAE